MISDDFETFIDDNFWRGQTKTKILVQKIIHFIKIQNIHSIKIFIFLKSRIFIQTKYSFFLNPEYSFKKNIHFLKIQNIHSNKIFIFSKRAVSPRANIDPTFNCWQKSGVKRLWEPTYFNSLLSILLCSGFA